MKICFRRAYRMTTSYYRQRFWLELGGQRLLGGKQQLSTHVMTSRLYPRAGAQAV